MGCVDAILRTTIRQDQLTFSEAMRRLDKENKKIERERSLYKITKKLNFFYDTFALFIIDAFGM